MESFGVRITDQMYDRHGATDCSGRRTSARRHARASFRSVWAVVAGIILGVFNAVMGGDATFKQVYAIVVHSGFLMALQQLFVCRSTTRGESMSSPTNLACSSRCSTRRRFSAMLLGGIDLFFIWLIVNLAIGLGVLYKRRTAPIAWTMLAHLRQSSCSSSPAFDRRFQELAT